MECSSGRRIVVLTGLWLGLFASFGSSAAAADPTITVLPREHPLVLTGMVESDPIEVEGLLWVKLEGWEEGKKGPTLILRLADEILVTKKGEEEKEKDEEEKEEAEEEGRRILGLTHLSFDPAEPVLGNGQATAIKVKVKDVEWPGLYGGTLTYSAEVEDDADASLKEAAEGLAGEVRLELDIRTKPRVVVPEDAISIHRVRCWWLGCELAGLFLGDDPEPPDSWPVEVRNDSLRAVVITPTARIRDQGSRTPVGGFDLSAKDASARTGVPISRPAAFELSLDSSRLRPGKYEGDLEFSARPALEPPLLGRGPKGAALVRNRTDVTVPVTIDVRAGVVLPILLVLLGIVAGRLNREISSTEAQARLKLYDRTVTLQERIARLSDEEAKGKLLDRLASVRRDIEDVNVPDDEIRQALDQLDEEIRLLEDLEDRQSELERQKVLGADADAVAEVQTGIDRARSATTAGNLAAAKETLTRVHEAIRKAAAGGLKADVAEVLSAPPGAEREAVGAKAPAKPLFPGLVKVLAILAGVRRVSVRAGYWYLQPLATLALLVALTVYGVYLFYTGDENSTFGVNGLVDYFPLFLWGFGSDVLTKRLQDISFTRS